MEYTFLFAPWKKMIGWIASVVLFVICLHICYLLGWAFAWYTCKREDFWQRFNSFQENFC